MASLTEKHPLLSPSSSTPPAPEPTLSELHHEMFQAQRRYLRAWSETSSGKLHRRIMISVTLLLLFVVGCSFTVLAQEALSEDDGGYGDGFGAAQKVPLEAHIMSKCPDARDCLHDLILPAMQQVEDLVDFRLSYIGSETEFDDGVLCMHGPSECVGNIIQLCAARMYPLKVSLGFTMCLMRDYEHIPERSLVEDCALEHGVSTERLNDCSVDGEGELAVGALKKSFRRSKEANVTTSCTVRLDGQVRCVRDGGKWIDCEGGHGADDLVKDVKAIARSAGWF